MVISDLQLFTEKQELTSFPNSKELDPQNTAFKDLKIRIQDLIQATLSKIIQETNSTELEQRYKFSCEGSLLRVTCNQENIPFNKTTMLELFEEINKMYLESVPKHPIPRIKQKSFKRRPPHSLTLQNLPEDLFGSSPPPAQPFKGGFPGNSSSFQELPPSIFDLNLKPRDPSSESPSLSSSSTNTRTESFNHPLSDLLLNPKLQTRYDFRCSQKRETKRQRSKAAFNSVLSETKAEKSKKQSWRKKKFS